MSNVDGVAGLGGLTVQAPLPELILSLSTSMMKWCLYLLPLFLNNKGGGLGTRLLNYHPPRRDKLLHNLLPGNITIEELRV